MNARIFGLLITPFLFILLSVANETQTLNGLLLRADEIPSEIMAATSKKKLPGKRGPTSFAAGYRQTKIKCPIYRHPNSMSPRIGSLKKGGRIWLEGVNTDWARGLYRQKSFYVPIECLK